MTWQMWLTMIPPAIVVYALFVGLSFRFFFKLYIKYGIYENWNREENSWASAFFWPVMWSLVLTIFILYWFLVIPIQYCAKLTSGDKSLKESNS